MTATATAPNPEAQRIEHFFDQYLSEITGHGYMMSTGTAPEHLQRLYMPMIDGNILEILSDSYKRNNVTSFHYFASDVIPKLIVTTALEIGMFYDGGGIIYLMAIANDDDEKATADIYTAVAETEGRFHQLPLRFSTSIFEKSDEVTLPGNYFKIKK
jgi:hypothetical protein